MDTVSRQVPTAGVQCSCLDHSRISLYAYIRWYPLCISLYFVHMHLPQHCHPLYLAGNCAVMWYRLLSPLIHTHTRVSVWMIATIMIVNAMQIIVVYKYPELLVCYWCLKISLSGYWDCSSGKSICLKNMFP